MNSESFIENSNIVVDFFGQFPKFHDSEILSLNFEISKTGYYPKMTLSLSTIHFGQRCEILFEFIDIESNDMDNFSNQNSIWEMNFSKHENGIKCVIEPNCGLSAEIFCKKVKVMSLKNNK